MLHNYNVLLVLYPPKNVVPLLSMKSRFFQQYVPQFAHVKLACMRSTYIFCRRALRALHVYWRASEASEPLSYHVN